MNKIILEGRPISTNHIYMRGAGHSFYMTKEAKARKEEYYWEAKKQWKQKVSDKPFEILVDLFFDSKRRVDYDNFGKLMNDSLTGIVWEDDSQVWKATITKHIEKENPRIEITVV